MSSVNLFTREISIKIVYYGPGLGGKTSSLQYIHRALKSDSRGQLVSLATGVDRTLYFDFLPVKLPKLRGYSIRVQLYTVPGQVHYNSTRKLVLAGCDGVVFVADSQRERDTANVESFENLRENLTEQGMKLETLPHILQFNKRDAPDVIPADDMNARLNPWNAPTFDTVATTGRGVFDALKSITTLVLNDLRKRGIWDGGMPDGKSEGKPTPAREFDRADASLAQRIQALSEAAEAVQRLEPPQAQALGGAATSGISRQTNSMQIVMPSAGNSGVAKIPVAPTIPHGEGLSELLPEGPARDNLVAVENAVDRGDYAEAVRVAARAFTDASKAESTSPEIAPVLHALMLGCGGQRYLRFCEAAQRAEQGNVSSQDALFAMFFLVDAALER